MKANRSLTNTKNGSILSPMNNYTTGGSRSGGPKFGGKKKFTSNNRYEDNQSREKRFDTKSGEQFSATCSECGKKCDVPFKPSGDKPVYCSACFGMKKSGNELRGSQSKGNQRERTPFGSANKSHRVAPTNTSTPDPAATEANILELKRQISGLEVKLNKILDLINPPLPSPKKAAREHSN